MDESIEHLLKAWFGPKPESRDDVEQLLRRWFQPDASIDAEVAERFGPFAARAAGGELDHWRADARGRLALILLLDQVPRQLERGTARAFAHDAAALELTLDGMRTGMDRELPPLERGFFYMPLQHSEDRGIQELSVRTFEALRDEAEAPPPIAAALDSFAYHARLHRDVVARFGRFPHRNAALGRVDTDEEREFLAGGGPRFGQ